MTGRYNTRRGGKSKTRGRGTGSTARGGHIGGRQTRGERDNRINSTDGERERHFGVERREGSDQGSAQGNTGVTEGGGSGVLSSGTSLGLRSDEDLRLGQGRHEGNGEEDALREEVNRLKRKLNVVEEEKNEAKKKILQLEADKMHRDTSIGALVLKVRKLEEGKRELSARNASIEAVKEQMRAVTMFSKNKGMKSLANLADGVPEIYLGLVLDMERSLDRICVREVFEVEPFLNEYHRKWDGRSVLMTPESRARGLKARNGQVVCPLSPIELSASRTFYYKSWLHLPSMVGDVVTEHLKKGGQKWAMFCDNEEHLNETVNAISDCKVLSTHVMSRMSYFTSYTKRVIRDALFESLGYDMLVSRSSVRDEDDHMKKAAQVMKARLKLMKRKDIGGEYDMSWWRRCRNEEELNYVDDMRGGSATVSEDIRAPPNDGSVNPSGRYGDAVEENSPDRSGRRSSIGEEDEQYGLFRNKAGKMVWTCFEGVLKSYGGSAEESEEDSDHVEWSITAVTRVDAWIMTILECLSVDAIRGGGRQKEYAAKFEGFLPVAVKQMTRSIYAYVRRWEPRDFDVWFGSGIDEGSGRDEVIEHIFTRPYVATVPVHNTSADKVYLAVERTWFETYIGKELGPVCDAYIAVLNESMDQFVPLA